MSYVYKASMVAMMAGSDFIKTSTGKESVNATLVNALVMVRAIRDYHRATQFKVGFKPAGGIRTAKDSVVWLSLMKEELGDEWTTNKFFRLGASALLGDIERQVYHYVTGRYAALNELP
jgi:deoxyribose-phosphate aldolase